MGGRGGAVFGAVGHVSQVEAGKRGILTGFEFDEVGLLELVAGDGV